MGDTGGVSMHEITGARFGHRLDEPTQLPGTGEFGLVGEERRT